MDGVRNSISSSIVYVLTKTLVDNGVGIVAVIGNLRRNGAGIKVLIVRENQIVSTKISCGWALATSVVVIVPDLY